MSVTPSARFGEIVELDLDPVAVESDAFYPVAGVYGFGRGLIDRGRISGSDTSYKTLNRLRAGQLILSRLKAFEGAIAVVPEEFDGFCVSQEFPSFRIDESKADGGYVAALCRWPELWSRLGSRSRGVGARRERVNAQQLSDVEIPLPSMDAQRRIVAAIEGIDRLVGPIKERAAGISTLRASLTSALTTVSSSGSSKPRYGWRRVGLGDVISAAVDSVRVEPITEYPNVGVYSFARGLFPKPPIDGSNTSARTLYRIRSGQFVYSRLFAFEGAYASVPDRFDGYFVSNEFPAFDVDTEQADVAFLTAYFSTPSVWERVAEGSKGLGVRRQRVQQEQLLAHVVYLPPLEEQRRIGRIAETLREVGRRRAKASALVDAIKPAALNRVFAGLG